ncbi:MAG TPA: ABC transporter ATP-binding protein [Anaerolineae bacterium]|jgi:manganese/zinc/iron transport system ATP- binding protein
MISYQGRHEMPPVAGAPALLAQDITVSYPGVEAPALKGVNLCVPLGSRVALVGPNGAGKSTLLRAAVGLLPVTQGTLRIHGNPVGSCPQWVAYLPQRGELDWRFPLSVRKLVLTGRYVHLGWLRRPGSRDWDIADAALAQMELTELAERQISQLSGGQQQRALLARALAQEADLLLLDEPLNAVDAATRHIVADVLRGLHAQGKTIIAATHELEHIETEFDDALYLVDGRESKHE